MGFTFSRFSPGPGHPDASAANPSSAATLDQESTAAAARNLSQLETGPKPGPQTWQQKPMGKKSSHQKGGKKKSQEGTPGYFQKRKKKPKRQPTLRIFQRWKRHDGTDVPWWSQGGFVFQLIDRHQITIHHPPSLETELMTTRRTWLAPFFTGNQRISRMLRQKTIILLILPNIQHPVIAPLVSVCLTGCRKNLSLGTAFGTPISKVQRSGEGWGWVLRFYDDTSTSWSIVHLLVLQVSSKAKQIQVLPNIGVIFLDFYGFVICVCGPKSLVPQLFNIMVYKPPIIPVFWNCTLTWGR